MIITYYLTHNIFILVDYPTICQGKWFEGVFVGEHVHGKTFYGKTKMHEFTKKYDEKIVKKKLVWQK